MEQTNLVLGEEEFNQVTMSAPHRSRILVVDDDVTSQPIWEHIISSADRQARVEWATSASEAERIIEQSELDGWSYDLIVSDIFLSGSKTGLDLWNRYHKMFAGRMVLISSIEHMKINKYMSGASETPIYLKKPLVLENCIEVIYELLHQGKF
jgi:response regulator of citrate/malate metabolism